MNEGRKEVSTVKRQQDDIAARFKDGDDHNDLIREVAKKFARALLIESEIPNSDMSTDELLDAFDNERDVRRRPSSTTERYAQEAIDDFETVREEIGTPEDRDDPDYLHKIEYQSGPTKATALATLAREINRSAAFDGQKPFDGELSAEDIIDALLERGRANR